MAEVARGTVRGLCEGALGAGSHCRFRGDWRLGILTQEGVVSVGVVDLRGGPMLC